MSEQSEEIRELIEKHGVEMEDIMFADMVSVRIFTFRARKHDFKAGWETKYLNELINTLKGAMVVFDIGAENGEFTAMAAKLVGCANVHIFEPTEEYWPNIKRLWDANGFEDVGGCFDGFVSDKNVGEPLQRYLPSVSGDIFYGTKHAASSEREVSIDCYCKTYDVIPNVIMMDIEGSELAAVRGAIETIKNHSPIFFISIHNDNAIKERSEGTKDDILNLFKSNGYSAMHINTDHEEHWKFYKE